MDFFTVIFMRKSLKGFPWVMWDIRHKILKVHVSCWIHNGWNRKTSRKLHIIVNTVYNTWRVTLNEILLSINLLISMMLKDLNHPFRLSYPFPESSFKKGYFWILPAMNVHQVCYELCMISWVQATLEHISTKLLFILILRNATAIKNKYCEIRDVLVFVFHSKIVLNIFS